MLISFEQATHLLKQGKVVAIPTETVYGLAAALDQEEAIRQIFHLKGRPSDNPLIVHAASLEQVLTLVHAFPSEARELVKHLWPGPLTLILEAQQERVSPTVRAGLSTVAVRIPSHPLALELIKQTGPLVAPSANLSGKPSGTLPTHIEDDFQGRVPVLDGGACKQGVESTIVAFDQGRSVVLRLGAITLDQLTEVLGYTPLIVSKSSSSPVLCPGQHYKHYAPNAKLILAEEPYSGMPGAVVGFSDRIYPQAKKLFLLGELTQPDLVAANLYAVLRRLDEEGVEAAWVDYLFPKQGIFLTVAERLFRAAASSY